MCCRGSCSRLGQSTRAVANRGSPLTSCCLFVWGGILAVCCFAVANMTGVVPFWASIVLALAVLGLHTANAVLDLYVSKLGSA